MTFVKQPQLALWLAAQRVRRVVVDPALEKDPVEISDERSRVSRRVGTPRLGIFLLEVFSEGAHSRRPAADVAFIDGKPPAARWHPHRILRQKELAERGIEREQVHAIAAGVNQNRRRPEQDVSGRDLFISRSQKRLLT